MASDVREKLEKADREFRAKMAAKGKRLDAYGRVLTKRAEQDRPMTDFWSSVNQGEMRQALVESGDERALQLAKRMMKPGRRTSLSQLCREEGVPLQQLNELWKKHHLAVGMAKMAERLPQVMEDVAVDALSTYEVCPRCDGVGQITRPHAAENGDVTQAEETCPQCKGAREVRKAGDKGARDLLFETVGLTKAKGGITNAVQVNIGDGFEDVMGAAQKLVQGQRIEEGD